MARGRGACWTDGDWDILVDGVGKGMTPTQIAKANGWNVSSTWKAIQKLKKGERPWRPHRGNRPFLQEEEITAGEEWVRNHPKVQAAAKWLRP